MAMSFDISGSCFSPVETSTSQQRVRPDQPRITIPLAARNGKRKASNISKDTTSSCSSSSSVDSPTGALGFSDFKEHFLSVRQRMGSLQRAYAYPTPTFQRIFMRNYMLIQIYDQYKKDCRRILDKNEQRIEEIWIEVIGDGITEEFRKPPPRLLMPWHCTSAEQTAYEIICQKYPECSEMNWSFYAKHAELARRYLEIQQYMESIEYGRPGGELSCVAEEQMFHKEQELTDVLRDMAEVKFLLDYNASQWLAWVTELEGRAMQREQLRLQQMNARGE